MKNKLTKQFIGFLALLFLFTSCEKKKTSEYYTVDEKTSQVEWKGYLGNDDANTGTFSINGNFNADEQGNIKKGKFQISIASLKNTNLPTEDLRRQIVGHLQSADFLNMAAHPNAEFNISEVKNNDGQHTLKGDLILLGKSKPVSFPVKITQQNDQIILEGNLKINRLDWEMTYASDPNATNGMYIKPEIDLSFKVQANKTAE